MNAWPQDITGLEFNSMAATQGAHHSLHLISPMPPHSERGTSQPSNSIPLNSTPVCYPLLYEPTPSSPTLNQSSKPVKKTTSWYSKCAIQNQLSKVSTKLYHHRRNSRSKCHVTCLVQAYTFVQVYAFCSPKHFKDMIHSDHIMKANGSQVRCKFCNFLITHI